MADFQQGPVPSTFEPQRPQAAEGGLTLQAAIAQSAELQPGFQPGVAPPPLAGLSPEELAAQIDPCTGLPIGAVRLIDGYVEDVECLLQPWVAQRETDDPRFDSSALAHRTARFLQVFTQVTGGPVAGPAEAELALRLQRGTIRSLVEEIRCLAEPGREAGGLVHLARWLGIEGAPAPHHYSFQLIFGVDGGLGKVGTVSTTLLRVTYQHPVLPGWTRLIQTAELGVALSAFPGPPVSGNVSLGAEGGIGLAEATSGHYFSPADFDRARYGFERQSAYVFGAGYEAGALSIDAGGHQLHVDVSGPGVKAGVASFREASMGAGLGELRGVGPAVVQPRAPVQRQDAAERPAVPAGFSELLFFSTGCAELDAVGEGALEALVSRVAQIVDRAPGAEPRLQIEGRASAEWAAARAGDEAQQKNEQLAVDRALAVQGALEIHLASAGLPARISRQIVAAAQVGDEPGAAFDRQVRVSVSFDLCGPRRAAEQAA